MRKILRILSILAIIGSLTTGIASTASKWWGDSNIKKEGQELLNSVTSTMEDSTSSLEKATVKKVTDGDTLTVTLNGNDTKIRLIGVDTPESVASKEYLQRTGKKNNKWGKKASDFSKKVLKNAVVYLEYDEERVDRYGRTLAYVYIKKDGKMVMHNKTLVKKGFARAVYYAPNGKYKKEFEKLQKKAKSKKLGFWKAGYDAAF
ncbi:MAG: thermonuclease family protein [Eubacterium sp.]|nr:thermonuclease family protein [Eubacterium sp.]